MLHIITPVSRPENIHRIAKSIREQIKDAGITISWILVLDKSLTEHEKTFIKSQLLTDDFAQVIDSPYEKACAGHAHRNFAMQHLREKYLINGGFSLQNYVYFLDDDTILHPDFMQTIVPKIYTCAEPIFIFHQEEKGNIRLYADMSNVKVCHIDMGMYMFNISILEKKEFLEDNYCADGIFIEEYMNELGPTVFRLIDKVLSYYNHLR